MGRLTALRPIDDMRSCLRARAMSAAAQALLTAVLSYT